MTPRPRVPAARRARSPVRRPAAPTAGASSARRSSTARSSTTSSTSPAELPVRLDAPRRAPGSYRLRADRVASARSTTTSASPSWKRFTHPADRAADPRPARRRPGRGRAGRRADAAAARLRRRPRLRDRRPRDPGSGDARRPARRRRPRRPARRRPRRRRRVRDRHRAPASAPRWAPGPEVDGGADIVLSELDEGFVVRAGTEAGAAHRRPARPPTGRARARPTGPPPRSPPSARAIGDPVPTDGPARAAPRRARPSALGGGRRALPRLRQLHARLPDLLLHQRRGRLGPRRRRGRRPTRTWDSCFSLGFGRVAGDANFRPKVRDRYRQWLTHKFSTWWDQFGSTGCVGCGRCIAWCPVGIDVREELAGDRPARRAGRARSRGRCRRRRAARRPRSRRSRRRPTSRRPSGPSTSETADTATLRLATVGSGAARRLDPASS